MSELGAENECFELANSINSMSPEKEEATGTENEKSFKKHKAENSVDITNSLPITNSGPVYSVTNNNNIPCALKYTIRLEFDRCKQLQGLVPPYRALCALYKTRKIIYIFLMYYSII